MNEYELPTANCERCGHEWNPRITKKPIKCPRCMSPKWSEPRVIVDDLSVKESEDPSATVEAE